MNATSSALADPEIFMAIEDLVLAGRGLADAVWLGRHASTLRAAAVEFHSHRPYEMGDDLRLVNWTLYARHRRLYVREGRQESRRPVYILVDATGSMRVAHGPWTKFQYAMRVAAGLAHLATGQGDAPALALLQHRITSALPPRTGNAHAAGICATLAKAEPAGPGDLEQALFDARSLCRSRGFVVLISDFFEKEESALRELASLRAQGHDVLALQILDPVEVELPRSGDFEFLDVESSAKLRASAEELYGPHRQAVSVWREGLKSTSLATGVRWESVTTAEPLAPLLRRWLE